MKFLFFALILIQGALFEAHALPALDSSFGNSGVARIGVPSGANDTPSASALQRDGKLLLAGQTRGRQLHTFVLRLLANGVLDTTFGQDGVAFVDLPNGYYIYSVAQIEQGADGSILVSGTSTIPGGGYGHVFARLTTAGVLDASFGTQGIFSAEPLTDQTPTRFAQQADGGLLIVSDATQGSQFALRLTRLTATGKRDLAYAPDGEKILGSLPPDFHMASGNVIAAEPDGGFTLMARATINPDTYLLVRVTYTGTLDVGFGNGGLVSGYDIGNPFDKPVELVRTANGGLLLKGDAAAPPPGSSGISLVGRKIVLWRVTAAGLADVSFGAASRLEVGSNYDSGYFRLAVLSDGSIALVDVVARVMHFDASGVLDSAFGTGGSATITLAGYGGFDTIGVLPNNAGGLLIPGAARLACPVMNCGSVGVDAAVASLDGGGHLQPGYGRGDGFAVWNNAEYSNDGVDAILVESSGKVVLAGASRIGSTFDYLLARLTAIGSPDVSFGTNGRVLPGQYTHFMGNVRAVEQASGAITVVTGTAGGSHGQVGTVTAFRLDSTGMLDAGFVPTLAAPNNANTDIALGVRPDGRLLYGTTTYDGTAILQQTMPDGTPDLNFGAGGQVVFPLSAGELSRQADMVLLGDGSVVFAVLTTQNLRLYKVDSRGLPVASFGTAGQFAYAADFPYAFTVGQAFSLLSLTDGSLLVGIDEYAPSGSPNGLLLAIRISDRGKLVGANNLLADQSYLTWSFAALPDASVVIARSRSDGTTSSAALYRLLPDNSLDGNFGLGGAAFPLHELQSVTALAMDANGRILVAGQDSTSAILARYQIDWPTNAATVVEFYNTNLDHYFITADSSEAAAIDGGSAGPGWTRTGNTFKSGGSTAVCRFYGSQSPGPNSHFYTLAGSECDGLKQLQASTSATQQRWNFESLDFVSTPASNGICPSGTTPVYRAYNNGLARGIDSNHRITSSMTAIQEVVNRGWVNEGVVMCAPN